MRMPQVSERIKEAPAQALRGVFAGIGQLLLITDKLRNKAPAHDVPQAAPEPPRAPEPTESAHVPKPSADSFAEAQKDLDKTGNVRLLTEEAPEPAAAGAPVAAEASAAAEAPEPVAAGAPVAAEPVAAGAAEPLPNYGSLTVASLRARLRNLSIDQVRELAEYERAHAGRPEVITMFERRVAKLEADA